MTPRDRRHWSVFLAGPIIGTIGFFVVYLAGEVGCSDPMRTVDDTWVRTVTVVSASVAVGAIAWFGVQLRRLGRISDAAPESTDPSLLEGRRMMRFSGALLLAMFAVFVLFLAVPNLGGRMC